MSESTSPLEHPACALSSRILHPALRYTFIQGLHPALPCSIHPVFQALSHLLNCFSMVSADSAVFLANPSTAPCSSCHTRCTGFDVTPAFSVLLSLPAITRFQNRRMEGCGGKNSFAPTIAATSGATPAGTSKTMFSTLYGVCIVSP